MSENFLNIISTMSDVCIRSSTSVGNLKSMSTTRGQPTLNSVSNSTVPAWIVLVYAAWNVSRLSSSTMIDSEGLAMYVSRMALPLLLDRLAWSNAQSASMHHLVLYGENTTHIKRSDDCAVYLCTVVSSQASLLRRDFLAAFALWSCLMCLILRVLSLWVRALLLRMTAFS